LASSAGIFEVVISLKYGGLPQCSVSECLFSIQYISMEPLPSLQQIKFKNVSPSTLPLYIKKDGKTDWCQINFTPD
jgi:hypothetical protein